MFRTGQGVPQDNKEAIRWYTKAAEQEAAAVQYSLGLMYGRGDGIPRDSVLVHMWFSLAAKNGYQPAIQGRDAAEAFLTPEQIAEAQKRANEWKKK